MAYLVHADDVAIAEQDRQAVRQGLDCLIVRRGEVFVTVYASVVGGGPEILCCGGDPASTHGHPPRGANTGRSGARAGLAPRDLGRQPRAAGLGASRNGSTSAGASRFRTGTATCVEMTMTMDDTLQLAICHCHLHVQLAICHCHLTFATCHVPL